MMITRDNYESYFIDLLDGILTSRQVDDLLDFLRDHPDLAEELKDLERIKLDPEPSTVPNVKALLKSDFDQLDVFEDACIRSIESDLSEKEEELLQSYIQSHPHAANEYRLFQATLAEPDPFINYDATNLLKKTRQFSSVWYAVAAIVIVGVLFWFTYSPESVEQPSAKFVALNEKPKVELQMHYLQPVIQKSLEEIPIHKTSNKPDVNIESNPIRTAEKSLELLSPVTTMVRVEQSFSDSFVLQPVNNKSLPDKDQSIYPSVKELLAHEIDKVDPQKEVNKFALFALNKLKNVTKNKLDYSTDQKGQMNKIEYSSKLLAFSIPVKSNKK